MNPQVQPTRVCHPAAERAVLGWCFREPKAIPRILADLPSLSFAIPQHRMIRDAIATVQRDGRGVDHLTVLAVLEAQEQAKFVGYIEGLELLDLDVRPDTVGEHIRLVAAAFTVRSIQSAASELARDGMHPKTLADPDAYVAQAAQVGQAARAQLSKSSTPATLGVPASLQAMAKRGQADAPPAAPMGLSQLDRIFNGGFHAKRTYVVGARPGVGKTALLLGAVAKAGLAGHPVMIFSLEMGEDELWGRMIYGLAEVSAENWERGHLSPPERDRSIRISGRLGNAPIWVDDSTTDWWSIEARAEAWVTDEARLAVEEATQDDLERGHDKRPPRVPVVAIDYIQLAHCDGENRERQIATMSRGAKLLAKRTSSAVVILSQLNRTAANANRRPTMADLRESGALEQDADSILLLHRPEAIEEEERERANTEGLVVKNRQGKKGIVHLTWIGSQTRFEDGSAW